MLTIFFLPHQIVPLPFNEEEQQQTGVAQPPVQQLINAAQAAAGAQPLQPFPVRQLPFRAYAVALDNRWVLQSLRMCAALRQAHHVLCAAFAGGTTGRHHSACQRARQCMPTWMQASTCQSMYLPKQLFAKASTCQSTLRLWVADDYRWPFESGPLCCAC